MKVVGAGGHGFYGQHGDAREQKFLIIHVPGVSLQRLGVFHQ